MLNYRQVTTWQTLNGPIEVVASENDSIKYFLTQLEAGFVVMEKGTGAVKAWVGNLAHRRKSLGRVAQSKYMAGGALKPFLFAHALSEGKTPCNEILRQSVFFDDGKIGSPGNDSKNQREVLPLKFHLSGKSIGVTTQRLNEGLEVAGYAAKFKDWGFEDPKAEKSLFIGYHDVSLLELTAAYSAFQNRGIRSAPFLIREIQSGTGALLASQTPQSHQVFPQKDADIVRKLLEQRTFEGMENSLRHKYKLSQPMAALSASSQNFTHGWFIGMTDDLLAGAWTGFPDRAIGIKRMSLGSATKTTLPIWANFMEHVYADSTLGLKGKSFPMDTEAEKALDCGEKGRSEDGPPWLDFWPEFSKSSDQ